jgi:histidinol-phosphatase (PHP family)
MLHDSHTHTSFSEDCSTPLDTHISAAKAKGLCYLAITDHCDYDFIYAKLDPWEIDLPSYHAAVSQAKQIHNSSSVIHHSSFTLASGIEFAYHHKANADYQAILDTYDFDVVVNSVHLVNDENIYKTPYFENKTKKQAYSAYLKTVLESLLVPYRYEIVGHIGYVTRMATYSDTRLFYADFPDLIDEILRKIISLNKCLEINTNTKSQSVPFHPMTDILKRYRELGGSLITFASDAHQTHRLAEKFGNVKQAVKNLGFKYFTVYQNGKEVFLPID